MSTDSPLNSYRTNPLQTTKHGSNAMPSNKGLHFGRKNGVSCFNSQLCHVKPVGRFGVCIKSTKSDPMT